MSGTRNREWGALERELLQLLRDADGPVNARDLQAQFVEHIPAYTTLMTALGRLERKGDVARIEESARRVRFVLRRQDGRDVGATMASALDDAGDRKAALLAFAGNLHEDDVALLRAAFSGPRAGR